jgi:hypothetical protein
MFGVKSSSAKFRIPHLAAALLLSALVAGAAIAQQPDSQSAPTSQTSAPPAVSPNDAPAPDTAASQPPASTSDQPTSQPNDQPPPVAPPAPKTYTVPAGTKVLLTLKSSINTKSASPGDGVYLVSAFPVVVGNRVLIPAGMYVQGTVDSVERHIRIKGHAKLNMHFTSMIFPNGSVVEIPGVINDIPGSKGPKVKNGEGTVEQTGGAGEVAKDAARGAEVGATGGVIGGGVEGHPFEGAGIGGAAGALIGAGVALFTHGNDIDIEAGSQVEMVLQRPLVLEDANLAGINAAQPQLVPTPTQRQPLAKPNQRRIICPLGVPCP